MPGFLSDARATLIPDLHGRQGPLPPLLITLTVVTGLVDAFSYLVLGRVFVANMTGNVIFMAFSLAGSHDFSLTASLAALLGFAAGALLGGRLANRPLANRPLANRFPGHRGRLLLAAVVVETVLVLLSYVATELFTAPASGWVRYLLVVLLGVAMGTQNAAARRLAVPDLTTTVLTLTITGIAADGRLAGGAALGLVGAFMAVPRLRRWLGTEVRPRLKEVVVDLKELAREPKRLGLIVLGCASTTLGAALGLWTAIEAFGGDTSFITVTVVTMVGGTLASAAPTPGGVGAVEAALIGGLAAFGVPAAVSVPSVLLYRVLTCWLPVFIGWPVMRWLTRNDMV